MKIIRITILKLKLRYWKWKLARKRKQMWKKHAQKMEQLYKDIEEELKKPDPYTYGPGAKEDGNSR